MSLENHVANPKSPFATKWVWLPGPPPPPGSVSVAVARLGRGPFVVESLHAPNTETSASPDHRISVRMFIVTSSGYCYRVTVMAQAGSASHAASFVTRVCNEPSGFMT